MAPPASKKDSAKTGKAGKTAAVPVEKSSTTPPAVDATEAAKPTEKVVAEVGLEILSYSGTGKPDQAAYNAEQELIKKDIDQLNVKLSALKERIGSSSKGGPSGDRRNQLKAELDQIREQQGDVKGNRDKIFTQLKGIQENIQRKAAELQANTSKAQFKTTSELDAHVRQLETQIESGTLKVLAEKRALQDITALKRQRKTIESFQADQDAIDVDRAKADELRKTLDNPETKALSDRFEAIRLELDVIKKEDDDVYASRSVLYTERDGLQKQLDGLYGKKRESSQRYRQASDKYWAKQQEDRAKKAERARAERQAFEDEKKKEIVERLRDDAEAPAYQAEIEDCQTLIDHFSGTITASTTGLASTRAELTTVPKLNLRKVEGDTKGLVEVKRTEEKEFFVPSKKGGKKGSKIMSKAAPEAAAAAPERFSVPLAKLSALASLSIPPPINAAEIPQTIENLKTKKEWLLANQEKETAVNKAKAEKEIAKLLKSINAHAAAQDNEEPAEMEAVAA